jgi:ATP-dependent exoDNAse (exonuclease V) alpha subunit
LRPAHEAWTADGLRVLGAAVAAGAAVAVTEEAGILPTDGVLVADEAGILGTRQVARLLEATRAANAKLVLVGDHRQPPELAADGTFRALARELIAVRLTENRRQLEGSERDALDELRDGDVAAGIDAYAAAGRVTVGDTVTDQRAALVAAWWQAIRTGDPQGLVMLAHRRTDVPVLNELARTRLQADG